MPEPLKNVYSQSFFQGFTEVLMTVIPDFKSTDFMYMIFEDGWEEMELKQRMYHISATLYSFLPKEFGESSKLLIEMVHLLKKQYKGMSFEYMFLPDYVEKYGMHDYKNSMKAMEEITQFTSCEFAIRPFLVKYEQTLPQMLLWSKHPNAMVRRLASEGSRPRLPWAMALPSFKKNPSPIIPILENLRNDDSEMVRRSVANNLNDISKDNPDVVVGIVKKWMGESENVDKLLKHACRTLLKQGNQYLMTKFGYGSLENIQVKKLTVLTPKVKMGTNLQFSFLVQNLSKKDAKIRLEYGIYFKRANGTLSKKVFKISEKIYNKNSTSKVERKHSFKKITTRKYYPGEHSLSIILNGQELLKADFVLT